MFEPPGGADSGEFEGASCNVGSAHHWLRSTAPERVGRLRPYQRDCIVAVEESIIGGKRDLMVAMATGTGKNLPHCRADSSAARIQARPPHPLSSHQELRRCLCSLRGCGVTHEEQLYRGLSSSQPNITVTLSFKLGRESHPLEHAGRGHKRGGPSLAFLLQTSRDVYSIAEIRDLALAVAAFAHNHRYSMQRCGKLGDNTKLTLVERS